MSFLTANRAASALVCKHICKNGVFAAPLFTYSTATTNSASEDHKKKILKTAVFDCKYLQRHLNFKNKIRPDVQLDYIKVPLTTETASLAQGYDAVSLFVNGRIDHECISELESCGVSLIALRCVGADHVDVHHCKRRGISVVNVPAYSPYAVAEFAATLLLCLNRKLLMASNRIRNGNFALEGMAGFDMRGKTIGIMGTGKIGQALIKIMTGFSCNIVAHDPYPEPEIEKMDNVTYVSLNDMLEKSDAICLCAPSTPKTRHIIDRYSIGRMKPGVILINTARGDLIKTTDLIDSLMDGRVGAAGLDVIECENDFFYEDHSAQIIKNPNVFRLMNLPNVILTSHMSFLTDEALNNIAETTIRSLGEFSDGKRMQELTFAL